MFGHCKHCPPTCKTEHEAPSHVECADCLTSYEDFLDRLNEQGDHATDRPGYDFQESSYPKQYAPRPSGVVVN